MAAAVRYTNDPFIIALLKEMANRIGYDSSERKGVETISQLKGFVILDSGR